MRRAIPEKLPLACAVVLWVTASGIPAEPPAPDPARTLAALRQQFTQSKPLSDEWFAAADRILELGDAGRKVLLTPVTVKMRGLVRQYRQGFFLRAKRMVAGQLAAARKKQGKSRKQLDRDVRALRQAVLDLCRGGEPDKKAIVATGDPAIATLQKMLAVTPEQVLAGADSPNAPRQTLRRTWDLLLRATGEKARGTWTGAQRLADLEMMCALLAIPADGYARKTIELNGRLVERIDPEEAAGIRDLNRIRLLLGLNVVAIDVKLCRAARDHSHDMRTKKFFSHTSPVPGKATPAARARRMGTSANAENIAAGTKTGPGANRMWWHSPGHFKNLLAGHRRIGLGRDEKTWTQMFGR